MENVNAQNVTNWKEKMKTKITLASLEDKSSSHLLTLGQPSNPRTTRTLEKAVEYELKYGRKLNPSMDRKKFRRIISNRLSAKRSRMKKAEYITDMEKRVNDLEETISSITPQLESYKEKCKLLSMENDLLQNLIDVRSNESKFREMELEQKQLQVNNLKELQKTTVNQIINNDQFVTHPYSNLGFYQKWSSVS